MDRRRFLQLSASGVLVSAEASLFGASRFARVGSGGATQTIAFGSCNDSLKDQSFWRHIARDAPDLWIWLGDSIYADDLTGPERRSLYQDLLWAPGYQNFRSQTPVIGTWDDHDYGANNADCNFPHKLESKRDLLDFLEVPRGAEVWGREGVYQSFSIGQPGQKVLIVLVDLRYHMDKRRHQLLGEEQWAWLEQEIQATSANLVLIGSSLNLSSPYSGFGLEGWDEYPGERRRLYELLSGKGLPTIILSGDRHYAEVSRITLPSGLPLYEVMSSGLTHTFGLHLPNPGALSRRVVSKNYGLLKIEWTQSGPLVRMQLKSTEEYALYREHVADFRSLRPC